MLDIFYNLIIFPIEQIIELCYAFAFRIFDSPGLSILGVSIAVSTLVLPVYLMAEKQQQVERTLRKKMKPEIDNIKAVFKGDKQYMLLSTLYRQNQYHPVYALRNSIDLFIQIPFFIAAYHFLHNLDIIKGEAFLFIKDLGAPDALFYGVNILPIVMTLINVISGAIYTRGFPVKDRIQLYGMAAVFLVLLYNSPAGLVLYWTSNNIYNLLKNILQKSRYSGKIIYMIVSIFSVLLAVFVLFFHDGVLTKRLFVAVVSLFVVFVPLWKKGMKRFNINETGLGQKRIFILSLLAVSLLMGLVIPSGLIASSVAEFSFIEPFNSPLPFIGITVLQSMGFFLWMFCVYSMLDRRKKIFFTFFMVLAFGVFVVNAFVFGGNYGFMTPNLHLSDFKDDSLKLKCINLFAMFFICTLTIILLLLKRKNILGTLLNIVVAAFLVLGIINISKITTSTALNPEVNENLLPQNEKVYTFSKKGKNVLVIDLDRAISGYIPYIFAEKPELAESFAGFIYYPNCISFGPYTIYGTPGIFGGYYYTPLEIQKRKDELWWEKYYESMQVLPRLFAENGYSVTVGDQPWMKNSVYDEFPNINVNNTQRKYTDYYQMRHKEISYRDYYKILQSNLIRFSFFKFVPLVLRSVIYDDGKYLSLLQSERESNYSRATINNYSSLYYLPEITAIAADDSNNAAIFVNDLTHEPAFFQAPEYKPAKEVTNRGEGLFSEEDHYHVNMAAFILLAKWFDFLKENGVYDNTRIIIVSDHGRDIHSPFPNNLTLPNEHGLEFYTALLLVKDFNADFILRTDNTFMTNADVPFIALDGIVQNMKNPFNGKLMMQDKDKGVTITSAGLWDPEAQLKYTFNIKPDQWLHVHDNIFDPANWTAVRIDE
jgi:YidC/Oxa1 family membrane protein insertase